jgi:hypothetical protein
MKAPERRHDRNRDAGSGRQYEAAPLWDVKRETRLRERRTAHGRSRSPGNPW